MDIKRRLFRMCLAANAESQATFAKNLGVTNVAISRFFAGFASEPVRNAVDNYIIKTLSKAKKIITEYKIAA